MRPLISFIAAVIVMAVPAAAHAAEVKVVGGVMTYVDSDPNATNKITVTQSGDGKSLGVSDTGTAAGKPIPMTSDGSCTVTRGTGRNPAYGANCPLAGTTSIDIQSGGLDDTVVIRSPIGLAARISGGAGNDKLTGGPGADTLRGEAGADTMAGGPGVDTVDYSDRTAPVIVSLDGVAGDGEAGENDNVATDVENVGGGAGDDTITGGAADNGLYGNAGNDTVAAAGGTDVLDGGPGDDVLDGGDGPDALIGGDGIDRATYANSADPVRVVLDGKPGDGTLGENDNVDTESVTGSPGDDVLIGNAAPNLLEGGGGADRILGGHGVDALDGGPGDDLIQSLDSERDLVTCGEGTDGVLSDKPDVRADCEYIKYRAIAASSTAVHLSKRVVRIPVRCSPATVAGCAGRLALKLGKRVLGTRTFHLTPGRRWVAKLTLTKSGASLVTRRHRIVATLVARDTDLSGVTTTTTQTIRVAG